MSASPPESTAARPSIPPPPARPPSPVAPAWATRLAMLAGIAAALAALSVGLTLPAVRITKLHLWDTVYSIIGGLQALRESREWLVFGIILLFSVAFPYAKLLLLGALWCLKRGPRDGRVLFLLEALGKWSMLDVLVVALAVLSLQSSFFVRSRLEQGVYWFAGAALGSMALSALTRRWARRRG